MPGNSSIIGALRVVLGLDNAQFESGAQTSARTAAGLEGALGSLGRAGIGLAGGLLAGTSALALFSAGMAKAGETAQYADDLAAAATRIGETAEALQELRHVGEANDIPIEKTDAALMGLNRTLGALRLRIGDGKIRAAFEELGIPQATLAHMEKASDILPLLADRISALGNHADQLQIAKKLQIEDLLPMLLNGAKGIEALRQEARDLGLVLDESVVNRMADMNEEMRIAEERSKAAGRRLSAELVPALAAIKNAAADAAGALAGMFAWFNRHQGTDFEIESSLKRAQAARGRADTIRNGSTAEAMFAANVPLLATLTPGWREIAAQRQEKEAARIDADVERRALAAEARAKAAADRAAEEAAGALGGFKLSPKDKSKKDSDPGPFVESLHTFVSQGGLADVKEAIKPAIEGSIVDVAGNVAKSLERNRRQISDQWRWTIEGGFQAFAYGGGKGLMRYLADQFRDGMAKRLTDWVMDFLQGTGKGSGGSGGTGVLTTILNAGKALLGFAGGGSFKVGGSGGVDSQLVQFMASPDERVTVTTPGQGLGMAGAMHLTVNVHAAGAFTRADMEQAVEVGAAAAFAAARQQVPDDLAETQKYGLR